MKINLVHFVLFILLAPYMVGTAKVVGLIVAILASNLAATAYGAYRAKSRYKIDFDYKDLVRTYLLALAPALPALLCTRLLPLQAIFKVVIAGTVYLVLYLTLLPLGGAITRQELQNLEPVMEKIGFIKPVANLILKYEYSIIQRRKHIHDA